jgi:hypothetical protein
MEQALFVPRQREIECEGAIHHVLRRVHRGPGLKAANGKRKDLGRQGSSLEETLFDRRGQNA